MTSRKGFSIIVLSGVIALFFFLRAPVIGEEENNRLVAFIRANESVRKECSSPINAVYVGKRNNGTTQVYSYTVHCGIHSIDVDVWLTDPQGSIAANDRM